MNETSSALSALDAQISELLGSVASLAEAIDSQSTLLKQLVQAVTKPRGNNRVEELLEKIIEYLELLGDDDQTAPAIPRSSASAGSPGAIAAASDGEALNGKLDAPVRRRR